MRERSCKNAQKRQKTMTHSIRRISKKKYAMILQKVFFIVFLPAFSERNLQTKMLEDAIFTGVFRYLLEFHYDSGHLRAPRKG